ncbi:MAG: hypothetical protein E6J78_03755 [Deltaproteobacteria bacterium]|nr:MAG: hypothetical protein E6J78_03755 [Deltaproteobacteria bacterium]
MLALALAISLLQGAPQEQPPSEDFELLPKEAAPDPAALQRQKELEAKLSLRRRMLQLHQLGGFLTLGSMSLAVIFGQLDYMDKYGGRGDTGNFHQWHRWTAYGSAAIFAATGALAVFAPSPLEKPLRLDTATLHKAAMATATAAMAAEVVLGIVTGSREGRLSQRDFALAHQIIGYTALVATFAGFTVLTF